MTLDLLREGIGVISHKACIFDRSIQEKLHIGKPDATRDRDGKGARGSAGGELR